MPISTIRGTRGSRPAHNSNCYCRKSNSNNRIIALGSLLLWLCPSSSSSSSSSPSTLLPLSWPPPPSAVVLGLLVLLPSSSGMRPASRAAFQGLSSRGTGTCRHRHKRHQISLASSSGRKATGSAAASPTTSRLFRRLGSGGGANYGAAASTSTPPAQAYSALPSTDSPPPSLSPPPGGDQAALPAREGTSDSAMAGSPPPPANQNGDGSNKGSDITINNHSEYEVWVRRLYQTNLFHPVKMGLENIHKLHGLIGNPMDKPSRVVIHVAGTNGKGSVALKIAKTLEMSSSGSKLRVGLFCSPHVSSFRERMQVNSQLISEEEVVDFLPKLYELCRRHDIPATFFEITTALAFMFYDSRDVDVVVLETGLGGRLDATNVVQAPALTIITSIGLEHTRILGDTIELIACEKAGIMKPGKPVLVGPNVPHGVLRQCAIDKGAGPYLTCEDVLGTATTAASQGGDGVGDDTGTDYEDYDVENARIASAAIKLVQESRPEVVGTISDETIREGISLRPPCRFEQLQVIDDAAVGNGGERSIPVVLDVAHNPPAMDYLVRKLQRTFPNSQFRVVVGMSNDKDLKLCGKSILQAVNGEAKRIHLVEASHPRAAKLEKILQKTDELGIPAHAHYDLEDRSVTKQIQLAIELMRTPAKGSDEKGDGKDDEEILVICGSVFLMAEAREACGINEPRDSPYIAEVAGAGVKHSQENFGNLNDETDDTTPSKN